MADFCADFAKLVSLLTAQCRDGRMVLPCCMRWSHRGAPSRERCGESTRGPSGKVGQHTRVMSWGAGMGRLSASPGHIRPLVQWFSKSGSLLTPGNLCKMPILRFSLQTNHSRDSGGGVQGSVRTGVPGDSEAPQSGRITA